MYVHVYERLGFCAALEVFDSKRTYSTVREHILSHTHQPTHTHKHIHTLDLAAMLEACKPFEFEFEWPASRTAAVLSAQVAPDDETCLRFSL